MGILDNRAILLGVRGVQALFAIIVLGLTAYVVNWWNKYHISGSPSEINFLLFTSLWTLLALVFLIIVPWRFSGTQANHKFAIVGVEAVTMIFWFAGFIAVAVFVGERVCFGTVCNSARAAAVFGAFSWLAFAATTGLAVWFALGSGSSSSRSKADPAFNVQEGV